MISERHIMGRRSRKEFMLTAKIGEGSSGIVHRATGEDDKIYAVKLPIKGDNIFRVNSATALRREAEIHASLQHQSIVPVVLFDETSSIDSDPFLVTPLANSDLNFQTQREANMPLEEAQKVSLQVAEALDVVHNAGLSHGDVKPHNVFLYGSGGSMVARLGDFGSALLHGAHEKDPVLATELYAAPERFDGIVSPAVDQYAWAAGIVYPSFTGEAPSDPDEYDALLDIYGYPRPMETIIGAQNMTPIHDVFQQVTAVALREFPSERYASMTELQDDLTTKLAKANELQTKNRKYLS